VEIEMLAHALWLPQAVRSTGSPKFTPSMTNCTDLLGVPLPLVFLVTVAVKVTASPIADGFWLEVTVVVVEILSVNVICAWELDPVAVK
jgi:hypothetical protein